MRFTYVIGVLIGLCGLFHTMATAQNNAESSQITLGVSPQLLDITANPGERYTATFRLTNASDLSVSIKATPKNFLPRGEEGAVDLTEDRTDFSLADWISVNPEETLIESRKTVDFEVFIDVPDTAEPGSHFGSVVFATIPPEQEGAGAVVSQEIAPVILVKVAGDVIETAEIVEFKTDRNVYSSQNSVVFESRIKNTGSVHFKPVGRIVIKNMFGRIVTELDLDQRNVLPNSIRQISNEWNVDGIKVGRYTAELTIVYGDQVTIASATTSFIFFPYQVIIPVILVGTFIVAVLYKGRQRISRAFRALSSSEDSTKTEK